VKAPSVLILGGSGLAGGHIATAILESSDASVVLGGRDEARLKHSLETLSIDNPRVTTVLVDASDSTSLRDAVDGIDLVVLAAQARYGRNVARASIDAGADVIDITISTGDAHPMEEFGCEAAAAGRCLIGEAGAFPGLPAVLVRLVAKRMDRLEGAFVGHVLNQAGGLPRGTVEEIVEDLQHPPVFVLRKRTWRRSRLIGMADRRKFDFGPHWGRRPCLPYLVREMRGASALFPSLQDAGVWVGTNPMADSVALPLALVAMKLAPRLALRRASDLVAWAFRSSRPPYGFVIKVEATGERGGAPATEVLTVSHGDAYRGTGVAVAALLTQWRDGFGNANGSPGFHQMGMVVDPECFLDELQKGGWIVA
jgi:hypothetical protein